MGRICRMKKVLFLLAFIAILASCGSVKSVSYMHNPLATEGCTVSYSTAQNDGQLMIVVTVKSDLLVFNNHPTMLLKNFKGEVLKLEGMDLEARIETGGVLINNVFVPITELSAMAEFPIDEKDIDFFASGVSKVRLSTVPIIHEREFDSDFIGNFIFSSLNYRAVAFSRLQS